eukprot:COSAG02_NODE_107_length_36312_cov_45.037942_21_plen_70_part_00
MHTSMYNNGAVLCTVHGTAEYVNCGLNSSVRGNPPTAAAPPHRGRGREGKREVREAYTFIHIYREIRDR